MFGRLYNEDAITVLDELDSKVCEVFLETYCEYTEDYARLLKSRKSDNLKVHSIHTLNTHFEPQLFSPCERTKRDAVEIFENCLRAGKVLNANYYTLHGKARLKKSTVFTDFKQIGEDMHYLTQITARYGMKLTLENVEWAYYGKPGFFTKIRDYAPDLFCCLDVKQARESGFDYTEYLEEMCDRVKTVHLSDIDEFGKTALPSKKGKFNFEELFKKLAYNGFNGNCVIEIYKENFTEIKDLKYALEYLRNIKEKFFKE